MDFTSQYASEEESPGLLLWQVSTLWRRKIEMVLKPLDLTHPQFVVLATTGWLTKTKEKISQADIGKQAALDPNTISQILRSLESKGLIERVHTPNERNKYPKLTPAGAKKLTQALPLVEKADQAFFIPIEGSPFLSTLQKLKTPYEVHEIAPQNFIPQVQIAACYIEIEGKLLLLQRAKEKAEPEKWGIPAGKLEDNETPIQAAKRELFEETGIQCANATPMPCLYIRKPEVAYIYHPFKIHLEEMPAIRLSNEHQNYKWATPKEIQKLPLIDGAKEALQHYRKRQI